MGKDRPRPPQGRACLDWSKPLGPDRSGLIHARWAGVDWSMPTKQGRPGPVNAPGAGQAWTS